MYLRGAVRGWNLLTRSRPSMGGGTGVLALAVLLTGAAFAPATAQQPSKGGGTVQSAQKQTADPARGARSPLLSNVRTNPDAKMLVQANELVYDYENERVAAVGKVQIYYDGAVLEADKVTHDRKLNRLNATGNVRYQSKDGNVIHTDSMDLDADFRDGFIQSLLIETADNTRIAAASAERTGGNITVLQSGAYTACEPCKDDPKKPPLWQVKAARIIHNERERVIHYENASIEFFGVPVAYFPYFWHPDPTVKRQTGFLLPTWFSNSRVGTGVNIPYYWALSPNYDFTLNVAPMTRQLGPLVSGEWRHRLVNGSYSIRAAGIFQQDKEAFIDDGQRTPGYRDFRGSVETEGRFAINRRWNWGWDAALYTDRFFSNDYSMANESVGTEKTSQIYLTGQGNRSYFDARAMYFTGFSRLDTSAEMPVIHPIIDHSYVLEQPVLGGELGFRTNFVSLSRREADFDRITTGGADCITTVNPGACLMRGMPGDYTRFSTEMNWRRTMTNPWGIVLKPFATARIDVASRHSDADPNVNQFIDDGRATLARTMPAVGMEARWPFISVHSWGTQIFEPIGQIVVRPNETHVGQFPNEDAQSLVFDDTNLFAIDKYSGYDRVEGGTRANVGVQYTANIHRYGMINMLFGQSYHLAGRNSYAYGDSANTGAESGLEHDVSDYVSRIYYQPIGNISYAARARFDKDNFDVRRLELEARSTWDNLSLSTIYARYDAQPQIGYVEKREGIYQTAALKLHENWTVYGGARYDLGHSRIDLAVVGLNYVDECFAATFSYVADYSNLTYTKPVHRIMLRMNLRTLGGTGFSTQVGSERTGP